MRRFKSCRASRCPEQFKMFAMIYTIYDIYDICRFHNIHAHIESQYINVNDMIYLFVYLHIDIVIVLQCSIQCDIIVLFGFGR